MAAKTTVNAKNLQGLGAKRLAELLFEFCDGDAVAKRRLRLELAAKFDPGAVGREVRKRIATLAKARSYIDWHKVRVLADDLETQRRAIVEQVAKADAKEALALMWRFLDLAGPIYERCDDSNGEIGSVFEDACADLGVLAVAAKPDPKALVTDCFEALQRNDYGQFDGLIPVLAPVLAEEGLGMLKARFEDRAREPMPEPLEDADREVVGWSSQGPVFADELAFRARTSTIEMALRDIAEALGDVDAYIAQFSDDAKRAPRVAADLASRLLAVGRAEEALRMLEGAELGRSAWAREEWDDAYLEVLDSLGRSEEAQALRWKSFCATLKVERLRGFVQRLPDFEDVEAEERAFEVARNYQDVHQALNFLISWPALDRAAALVLARAEEVDGDHYYFLTPAAEKLEERYPLAATILRRAMIEFALETARSKRYRHAARHLLECESLIPQIPNYGALLNHGNYVAQLKAKHGRKSSFWSLLP